VAKPPLPFAVLKRRLERRLKAVGITVKKVMITLSLMISHRQIIFCLIHSSFLTHQIHEEEWSYIPVGGPLPISDQSVTAFGAAASLIHPATGA